MGIRRRTLFLGGAAVAGLAACSDPKPSATNALPTAFPTGTAGDAGSIRAVMAVRPGWLPEGLTEVSRMAHVGSPRFLQTRGWLGELGSIDVEIWPATAPKPDASRLSVAGRPMWIERDFDDLTEVGMALGQGLEARVHALMPGSHDTALRVAASLTTDGRTVFEVAMRFGWLPETVPAGQFGIAAHLQSDGEWVHQLYSFDSPRGPARAWASLGSSAAAALEDLLQMKPTDPVTARGRPALCGFDEPIGRVLAELPTGKWLCVNVDGFRPPLGRVELLRVADELWIGHEPVWRS